MSPRPPRAAVALRGTVAAAVATLAATVGHGIGQQALPSAWIVVVAFAIAAPACVALAGRRLSIARLGVAVVASQLAFHALLRLDFTGAAPGFIGAAPGSGAGHHGAAASAAMVMTDAAGPAGHELSPAMWLGHALAALVTVVVLATGERAVALLVSLALRPFRVLADVAAPGVAVALAIGGAPGIRPALVLRGAIRRRGPPVLA